MSAPSVSDLVLFLARSIVAQPDEVRVELKSEAGWAQVELHVAKDDLAIVIGRGGRTAQALRSVVDAYSWKHRERVRLHIAEDGPPRPRRSADVAPEPRG